MGKMSRDKGKAGEREVAELIRSYGFEARRGQQYRGGPGSPDVIHSIPNVHVEVKRTQRFNAYDAMQQAEDEAAPGEVPVVFHRRNACSWLVVMHASAFLKIMKRVPDVSAEGDNCSYVTYTLPTRSLPR